MTSIRPTRHQVRSDPGRATRAVLDRSAGGRVDVLSNVECHLSVPMAEAACLLYGGRGASASSDAWRISGSGRRAAIACTGARGRGFELRGPSAEP